MGHLGGIFGALCVLVIVVGALAFTANVLAKDQLIDEAKDLTDVVAKLTDAAEKFSPEQKEGGKT